MEIYGVFNNGVLISFGIPYRKTDYGIYLYKGCSRGLSGGWTAEKLDKVKYQKEYNEYIDNLNIDEFREDFLKLIEEANLNIDMCYLAINSINKI